MRHRSLLYFAPLLAAFAACANFGTTSEPTPVATSATTPPPPPPTVPPPGVDAGGGSVGEPDGAAPLDAEVDTARPPLDAGPSDAPVTFAKKLVFVTAETYFGNFGVASTSPGDRADELCRLSAGTLLAGPWAAYLSSSRAGALSRLPPATEWYLPTPTGGLGTRVFASRVVVTSGPEVPINVTAAGATIEPTLNLVWTGTTDGGLRDADDCGDWRAGTGMGRVGDATSTDPMQWSSGQTADCLKTARLYCFQL